jgi:hypothetical protein
MYCDCVEEIDRNPPTRFREPTYLSLVLPAPPVKKPVRVDLEALAKIVKTWRKKYPYLSMIYCDIPADDGDDSYTVTVGLEKSFVTVMTSALLDMLAMDVPDDGNYLPPAPPTHGDLSIIHAIQVKLVVDPERGTLG